MEALVASYYTKPKEVWRNKIDIISILPDAYMDLLIKESPVIQPTDQNDDKKPTNNDGNEMYI